jgi:hypothetical protein
VQPSTHNVAITQNATTIAFVTALFLIGQFLMIPDVVETNFVGTDFVDTRSAADSPERMQGL